MNVIHNRSIGRGRPDRVLCGTAAALLLIIGLAEVASAEPSARPVATTFNLPNYSVDQQVNGNFAIAGSDTMQPLMVKLLAAFKHWQPAVKGVVQGGGSDAALRGFIGDQATIRRGDAKNIGHHVSGSVALLASSRALTPEERADFLSRYGFEPTEIPVAMDAVAIYVHRDNPVPGLTMDQVDAIFSKDRKRGLSHAITKWGDLGLENSWGPQPIKLYGRDKRSGTRTFFIHEALLDGPMNPSIKEAPGSASEILEISRDPYAIGYAGTGFQASTVRVVPLAPKAGMAFVTPGPESALDGSYPLARHLYLYAKKAPDQSLRQEVVAFLKFINSREGQEMVVKSGYYPLSEGQIAKNMQIWDGSLFSAQAYEKRR